MGHAYIGYDGNIRLCNTRQGLYFPCRSHTHLKDRYLSVRFKIHDAERQPEIVVKVFWISPRLKGGRGCIVKHVAGAGLSYASRNRNPAFERQTVKVVCRQSLKCLGGVFHCDYISVSGLCGKCLLGYFALVGNHHSTAACLEHLPQKVMSVVIFALKGKKQVSRLCLS